MLPSWYQDLADYLYPATTSILIANGALLAMISVRNAHLSDRARANVREALVDLDSLSRRNEESSSAFSARRRQLLKERLNSLKRQNERFIQRYKMTSVAFVAFSTAIILFAMTNLFSAQHAPVSAHRYAGLCGLMALIASAFGIALMMFEFITGPTTLRMNNEMLDQIDMKP